jgi:hypothetical protein
MCTNNLREGVFDSYAIEPRAQIREISGLKFEQDIIESVDHGLSCAPLPVDNGNAVAMEKITIAHEGFELV